MLISCERCSTTYPLDDNLVPAAGASVQCTKCGNVFVAKRPAAPRSPAATAIFGAAPPPSAPRPPAPAAPSAPRPPAPSQPPSNRTMMFGAPGAAEAPKAKPAESAPRAGNPAASRTMIFGGPAGSLPDEPKPKAAPPAPKTMIFGADSLPAPEPAAKPAAPVGSRTMIFGGPSGSLPEEPKPKAAASAPRTMIFGADTLPPDAQVPKPAAPVGSKTMIFGGPAGSLPDEPKPRAAPVPKTTSSGGPAGTLPDEPKPKAASPKTIIFGADSLPPPEPAAKPAAPVGSKTMIFGGPAGSLPDAPKPKAPPAPEPPPPAIGSRTMIFGGPAEPPAESVRIPGEASARSETGRTMSFGAPGQAPVTGLTGNMVFGADEAREHPERLTEHTVRVDLAEFERHARGEGGLTPPAGGPPATADGPSLSSVDTFPPDLTPDDLPPRQDRTVQVAISDVEGTPEKPEDEAPGARPPAEKPKTQLFAMSDLDPHQAMPTEPDRARTAAPDTDPGLQPLPPRRAERGIDPSFLDTLEPGASGPSLGKVGSTLQPVPVLQPHAGPQVSDLSTSRTDPNRSPLATPDPEGVLSSSTTSPSFEAVPMPEPRFTSAPIELPPEAPGLLSLGGPGPDAGDAAAELQASTRRRSRLALALVLVLAVGAVLAIALALFGPRLKAVLSGTAVPPTVVEAAQRALLQLKGDEPGARDRVVGSLRATLQQYPRHVASHAALLTALVLEYDEVRARAALQRARYEELTQALATLERDKVPNADQKRAVLRARMEAVQKAYAPLETRARPLGRELEEAALVLDALARDGTLDEADQARAHGARTLYLAVLGDPATDSLAAAWAAMPGRDPLDPFVELSPVIAALNAREVDSTRALRGAERLQALLKKDNTVHRAAVLVARARLASGDWAGALADLEPLVLQKRDLVLASELLQRAKELPAASSAETPPEPTPEPSPPEPAPPAPPEPAPGERDPLR